MDVVAHTSVHPEPFGIVTLEAMSLAKDVDDNPVFLSSNKYNLKLTLERWPTIGFHATREHGERLSHGAL